MKTSKTLPVIPGLAVAVVAIGVAVWKHQQPPVISAQPAVAIAPAPASQKVEPPIAPPIVSPEPPAPGTKIAEVAAPTEDAQATAEVKSKPPKQHTAKAKPPIQDPDARAALSYVGMDSDAEDYWMGAINDLSLPSEERKDLIEDLNEDGLSDPHLPTAQDMPLIANRIMLIEELAPYAADEVNAKAFAEAYKDLVNLWNGLSAD